MYCQAALRDLRSAGRRPHGTPAPITPAGRGIEEEGAARCRREPPTGYASRFCRGASPPPSS
jgi:hypothetical protein